MIALRNSLANQALLNTDKLIDASMVSFVPGPIGTMSVTGKSSYVRFQHKITTLFVPPSILGNQMNHLFVMYEILAHK
jgi:hypothetical protein